jgi:hypothetical protein
VTRVAIATLLGPLEVDAVFVAGDWAVTPRQLWENRAGHRVTHVPTGLAITEWWLGDGRSINELSEIVTCLALIGPCPDLLAFWMLVVPLALVATAYNHDGGRIVAEIMRNTSVAA